MSRVMPQNPVNQAGHHDRVAQCPEFDDQNVPANRHPARVDQAVILTATEPPLAQKARYS